MLVKLLKQVRKWLKIVENSKIAIFNRIYTGKEGKNDIFVIEFPEQLEFYKDRLNNILYSNKYDIVVEANMKKEDFYRCIQMIINIKYENNELTDAVAYTKSEWEDFVSTWKLPEVK